MRRLDRFHVRDEVPKEVTNRTLADVDLDGGECGMTNEFEMDRATIYVFVSGSVVRQADVCDLQ